MALPVLAVASTALRLGIVAYGAYSIVSSVSRAPADFRGDAALDDLQEGLAMRNERDRADATYRWKRTIRLGQSGPGLEIDAAAFGRIRFRKV